MTRILALGGALMLAAALVQFVERPDAAAATRDVAVNDDVFVDSVSGNSTTTITAGDTVVWTWNGSNIHSVTSDDDGATFDSNPGSWQSSGTFQFTFTAPGTYEYFCRVHSTAQSSLMNGTVVVQAQQATNTPAPATNTPPAATSTVGPSSTPGRDDTPTSTTTPVPPGTTPVATSTPMVINPIAATVASDGRAAASGQLPSAGDGGSAAGGDIRTLAIVLAALGAAAISAAGALRLARHSLLR